MKNLSDRIGLALLAFAIFTILFGYGFASAKFKFFPYNLIREAYTLFEKPFKVIKENDLDGITHDFDPDKVFMGLNLASVVVADYGLAVQVFDMKGKIMHQWDLDWDDIWPNPTHLSAKSIPKTRPGTNIHGMALLDNGDLVFNYDFLGLVKVNLCGDVVWRLNYKTHHSIYVDEDGMLWVSALKDHNTPLPELPHYRPPFIEPMILQVSPDGEILKEISIFNLLKKNGLEGLLYISDDSIHTPDITHTPAPRTGDTLHLNDVETFPQSMAPGFFHYGDVMISLRNINTVLVFDMDTETVKFQRTGDFIRQHDPDFLDGNTISVFDNHVAGPISQGQSQILAISAIGLPTRVLYSGTDTHKFYTNTMGKSQRLPNGNLLISEPKNFRAFEVTNKGEIVWQHYNRIDEKTVGLMGEVQRIPLELKKLFEPNDIKKSCN